MGLAVVLAAIAQSGAAFRGPMEALVALAGAAFVAFGLPTAVRGRRSAEEPRLTSPDGAAPDGAPAAGDGEWFQGSIRPGSRRRALASVGISVGAWLPYAALWSRFYPDASTFWVYVAAVAIGAIAALCSATGRSGVGSAAGAGLLLIWVGFVGLLLPGEPRWLTGADPEAPPGARGPWSIVEVGLELAGPLKSATLAYDGYPPLVVEADLLPGESRSVRAWIVAPRDRSFAAHERPDLVDAEPMDLGGVVVSLLDPPGSLQPDGPILDAPEAPLQPALPQVGATVVRLPRSARLAAAATAALLALAVIRYGARIAFTPLALLIGAGGAAFCSVQGHVDPTGSPSHCAAVVLEGLRPDVGGRQDPGAGIGARATWSLVQRFGSPLVEELAAEGAVPAGRRIRVGDLRGPLRTRVAALGGRPATRSVEARAAGEAIDLVTSPFDPGLRLLMREVNTLGAFDAAWIRSPDGQWSGGGSWAVGEPMAAAGAAGEFEGVSLEPPPWAGAGLPMGVAVFVGRLNPAAAAALGILPGSRPRAPDAWVRLVDF